MEGKSKQIELYVTQDGKVPFREWFNSLKDLQAKLRISKRLDRIELGNLGDFKSLDEGVFELRIDYGGGYRIYFGQVNFIIVLLLCGGDKKTQKQDIQRAKYYWQDYQNRRENDEKYELS